MKLLVLGAVLGALVVGGVLPASAQIVVRDLDRDAAVVVHEGRHEGWRHESRHEGWRHEGWRRHHAECRVVKVRKTLPNGNVIVKTRRTCD